MVTTHTGLPGLPPTASLLFRKVSARASKTEIQEHGPKTELPYWGLSGQTSLIGVLCLDVIVLVKIFHLELAGMTDSLNNRLSRSSCLCGIETNV